MNETNLAIKKWRWQAFSLRQTLFLCAGIGIMFPAIMLGYFQFTSRLTNDLEQRVHVPLSQSADVLARGMAVAIWNVDPSIGDELVDAVMRNADIVSITVTDEKNEIFVRKASSYSLPGTLFVEKRDIKYNGANVGRLEVVMTAARVESELWSDLAKLCFALGSQVLFSFAVIWLFFDHRILRPLRRLKLGVLRLAGGDLERPIEHSRDDEIGHLVVQVDSMRRDLAMLIAERDLSNAEILELNLQLEERINDRTIELSTTLVNLQAAQKELVRTEKLSALGSMVAGIAHELNTPIGNGLTVASTLQGDADNFVAEMAQGLKRSRLEEFVGNLRVGSDILVRSLKQAAELVSSFKQVAVDQASANRRRFNLQETVNEILLTMGPTIRKTKHRVHGQIPSDVSMDGYPGALGQVLTNLIHNALVHGFEGRLNGLITVSAETDDSGGVRIKVQDDGVGIPENHMARVFDPFFTTKFGQGGSGLGLNIVHNLITQTMAGSIRIESAPGQGTCFILNLPLVAPQSAAVGIEARP